MKLLLSPDTSSYDVFRGALWRVCLKEFWLPTGVLYLLLSKTPNSNTSFYVSIFGNEININVMN